MMDLMPENGEAIVEFGADDEPAREPGRRAPVGAFLTGLAADRRLVPLAAALGGVALFASLISEWQLTAVDGTFWGDGEVGARPPFETTVADLGGWGGGYLAGLFLLIAPVVLTLFGPPAGRRYARLCALSTGGVLLAMVLAMGSYLGDISRTVGQLGLSNIEEDQIAISLGRGTWCAAVGVILVLASMVLAGRHLRTEPAPVDTSAEAEPPVAPEAAMWSWRRPVTGEEDALPDAPFDLTVAPVKPFITSPDNRDAAGRGISE
jgi:hypothetical protein